VETITTDPIANIAANDPGPIELDAVMKSEWATVTDPMAGRDLQLSDASNDEP
jgi:hypothetical protein